MLMLAALVVLVLATGCASFEGAAAEGHSYNQRRQLPVLGEGRGAAAERRTQRFRSNSTHVFWAGEGQGGGMGRGPSSFQPFSDAVRDAVEYLRRNIMPFDVPNTLTLGFPPGAEEARGAGVLRAESDLDGGRQSVQRREQVELPDGLSDGIVNQTVHLALQTKMEYAWADIVPRQIFMEYILSFCCTNEARTNWRPLFTTVVKRIIDANMNVEQKGNDQGVEDVVTSISKNLWSALSSDPTKPIHFVAGQTPLIFDPMSVIAYGFASCTGMSIVLVFALRAAGIPARLVGTPAWNGDVDKGNHNWVEVWTPTSCCDGGEEAAAREGENVRGEWRILEGDGDSLDKDPCERWFCNAGRFDGDTQVYAARLDRSLADCSYPLAWDAQNWDVPGEDRTSYYTEICNQC
jgi:hypothetical protein